MIVGKKYSIVWKFLEYAFYAFFLTFPFINYSGFLYTGTTTRSVNLVILASVLGIAFGIWLFKKGNSVSIAKSPIVLSVLVYFFFVVISALHGLDFSTSFWSVTTRLTGVWYMLNFGLLFFLLFAVILDEKKQRKIALMIILSTALYSLLAFLGPEGVALMFKGYQSPGFTFGNSTFAGMYLFGSFLLSIYYAYSAEVKKWWMYVLPILLVINPYIIGHGIWGGNFSGGLSAFVGESRSSAYATLLSIFALAFIWAVSKIKNVKARTASAYGVYGVSIVLMIFSAFSLLSHDGYLRKIYLSQASGARPLVWEVSEGVIKQRPLLGWGTDNFEQVFNLNYDNRQLEAQYGNEPWFDRAHNVFIDQIIDNGAIGLVAYILIYLVVVFFLLFVALRSREKKDATLASVLIVYFAFHLLELQTAFDTSISYVLILFMLASAGVLFHRTISEIKGKSFEWKLPAVFSYTLGAVLVAFSLWSSIYGTIPFVRAQIVNGTIRTIGYSEKRIPMYPVLFGSQIDRHAILWRTSTDFQRGIRQDARVLSDPKKVESLKKEIGIIEEGFQQYVKENPDHFRAKLNLADVLMFENLFAMNKLEEAQGVLDDAIKLVPQNPQPYWIKAVGYIYMRKFDLAREYAKRGFDLNPKINESRVIMDYVERSIKTFPEVDLYFFSQT